MNWDNYMLRVERHSHHNRDDWGVEYDSYNYFDADLSGIEANKIITLMEYFGEDRPLRSELHTKMRCILVTDDSLGFAFNYLENQDGININVKADESTRAYGSSDRHSATYTVTLIPKSEYQHKKGDIKYI